MKRKHYKDEPRRTRTVSVRLTPDELAELDRARGGWQRGAWLRVAALEGAPPAPVPEANVELWRDLARVGSNLNQLVRILPQRANKAAMADEVDRALRELRDTLIRGKESFR